MYMTWTGLQYLENLKKREKANPRQSIEHTLVINGLMKTF